MAANKLKPAKKKTARPAGAKKKARGKKPKPTEKRAQPMKKNGAAAAPPPAATVAKPVEPETPIEPPVLPTPTATFTF